jgi:hypothetical protein
MAAERPVHVESVEPQAAANETTPDPRVPWGLVHALQEAVSTLEAQAMGVAAIQLAGLISIWTQLYTFDEALGVALVWTAWAMLVVAVAVMASLVVPRPLATGWRRVLEKARCEDEAELRAEIFQACCRRVLRLHRGLQATIPLSAIALVLIAVAYIVEKS